MTNEFVYFPELTAISRKNPSFPMRWLEQRNYLANNMLDFGSGKGRDYTFLEQLGYNVDCYDKYYAPTFPSTKYDYIACHYVLNVVGRRIQTAILAEISYLLKPNGVAYFTVRRDLKEEGIRIHAIYKKPTYQCLVYLPFESIFSNRNCEIYRYQKPNNPHLILESLSVALLNDGSFYGKESQSYTNFNQRELTAIQIIKNELNSNINLQNIAI